MISFICFFFYKKRVTLVHIYSLLITSNVILELLKHTFCLGDPELTNITPHYVPVIYQSVPYRRVSRNFLVVWRVYAFTQTNRQTAASANDQQMASCLFWLHWCDRNRSDNRSDVCARRMTIVSGFEVQRS